MRSEIKIQKNNFTTNILRTQQRSSWDLIKTVPSIFNANDFNFFFVSIANTIISDIPLSNPISEILYRLHNSKSNNPYQFSAKCMKTLNALIEYPLTKLISTYFENNVIQVVVNCQSSFKYLGRIAKIIV